MLVNVNVIEVIAMMANDGFLPRSVTAGIRVDALGNILIFEGV